MIRQTGPLLLLSLAFASIVACIPPFFTPLTTGNTNATGPSFAFPGPFGFLIPFGPVTNSSTVPGTTTNGSVVVNTNTPAQTPSGFNENGTFNLNFNNTFNLNFSGVFNLNNSVVNQNVQP
jgi:hypothetical protein